MKVHGPVKHNFNQLTQGGLNIVWACQDIIAEISWEMSGSVHS